MTDLEKVIKGLECCSDAVSECGENCPYWNIKNCQSRLQADALALLKAQEPRVMTLEEVQVLCNNDVVWLEDKGNPKVIPGIVKSRHLWPHSVMMVTNFIRSDGRTVTAGDEDYGVRWRAWTSEPTDEQREATPWMKN